MSSLSSTAEEILELCGRDGAHSDPKVARAILLTDMESLVWGSGLVAELRKENADLDYQVRRLEADNEDLDDQLEELQDDYKTLSEKAG